MATWQGQAVNTVAIVGCRLAVGGCRLRTLTGDVLGALLDQESVSLLGLRAVGGSEGRAEGRTVGSLPPDCVVKQSRKKGPIERPFVGLPPVPHKLMARILRGGFVDMAELLYDNLEA